MTQAVLIGGVFIGVLSGLPIVSVANFCCCLWVVAGGMLTAYLTQQNETLPLTPVRGAVAGLAAGVVGAVVWLVVSAVVDTVTGPLQQRFLAEMLRNTDDMPPGAREWMQVLSGPGSSALRLTFGLGLHLFAALFAAVGGLLGAVFFRRDPPPAIPGEPVMPPPLPPQ